MAGGKKLVEYISGPGPGLAGRERNGAGGYQTERERKNILSLSTFIKCPQTSAKWGLLFCPDELYTVEKTHQGKSMKNHERYEKVGFDVKKGGVRYIPCRVRYVSKQMRMRLIHHSFYIIIFE